MRGQFGIPDASLKDEPGWTNGKDKLGTGEANGLLAPRFRHCPVPRNAANESVRGKFKPHRTTVTSTVMPYSRDLLDRLNQAKTPLTYLVP